ncbi:phospholipid scramblase-related protein [Modestobacter sp. Leaf380]|uniref:phospholipid scramblase-related protein n=1 Tax=Modestobacter sp. Leaf380 TaxID=1736356 RepID=UPI0006F64049|nr:phospholipid scramblase-related protein [Modestobacter sp. Leaf380]KQS68538.1 scramblase [Modestobacter sp. Leaf380]
MSSPPPPPGWYPDPAGTPGTRWWDGNGWTEHVQQAAAPPPPAGQPAPAPVQVQQAPAQPQPVQYGGAPPRSPLFEQPTLVVNQKTKLIELTNEYSVFDANGQQIGAVVQVGQSAAKKALRFVSQLDQFLTHQLEVRDAHGVVLHLTRPAKLVKSRVQVSRGDGTPVGEIVQANVFGKIRFDLVVGGQVAGAIQAENWRAWDFSITDHTGQEVARITKKWEGFLRTSFTTADNYVVQVHRRLEDPLASLVVASALTVDTTLKQDDRGFN